MQSLPGIARDGRSRGSCSCTCARAFDSTGAPPNWSARRIRWSTSLVNHLAGLIQREGTLCDRAARAQDTLVALRASRKHARSTDSTRSGGAGDGAEGR
jgi:hypothetical protein